VCCYTVCQCDVIVSCLMHVSNTAAAAAAGDADDDDDVVVG